MLGLPKSTEMSKQLSKKAVYAKFQNPYIPKGMTDLITQQQKYQTTQSVVLEQMKNMLQSGGKDQNNG